MKNRPCFSATGRLTTAALLAALALPALHARAIDWDGDFPTDGNFDGKIDNPDNWEFNFLPGPGTGVNYNAAATYTVFFGTDFETAGGVSGTGVENGDVTFESLGGSPTYAINGFFTVNSILRLDGVDLDSGQNTPLQLHIQNGGQTLMQNGTTSRVGSLRVGDTTTDGSLRLDGMNLETTEGPLLVLGGGISGGLLELTNGAELDIQSGPLSGSLLIGRPGGTSGTVRVLGGSSVTVDGLLGLADSPVGDGVGLVELAGNNSHFEITTGNNAQIGADSLTNGRFTAGNNTQADFGGDLTVRATGTLQNFGGAITVAGAAQIDGSYEQSGGTTLFKSAADFGSGASFNHTGGTILFSAASTIAIQDVTIGGSDAAWDIDADVAYNRRLRLAGDDTTTASITVADSGGTDAVLRNTGTGGQADLAVGFNGTAQLFVSDRGLVDIFDDVIIGHNAGSVGQVFVTGDGTLNITDRSTLRVNRNGAGSNLFVGFDGDGVLSVAGGGLVEVGNDLVVQASDFDGNSSSVIVGVDPSLDLDSIDTVTVGRDLLIGNNGGAGGSTGLYWQRDRAMTTVGRTTHVRAAGELRVDDQSTLGTVNLTTDPGATLSFNGGVLFVDGGTATLNHGDLILNGNTSAFPGTGRLTLGNGADAVLDGELIIANAFGEQGMLEVYGPGSTFNQTAGLKSAMVGAGGTGVMSVLNGGFAEINVEIVAGQGTGSNGIIEVSGVSSGVRSTLVVDNLNDASFIRLAQNGGIASMEITDGALVQVGNALFVGDLLTSGGTQTLSIGGAEGGFSAELRAKFLTVTGVDASADINNGALVVLSSDTPFSQLQAFNGGEINLTGGEVFAPQVSRDGGSTINWTGGTLHTEDVMGDLTNAGGTLAPGLGQAVTFGTTTFANDYTQTAAGTLEIEIAGNTQGTEFDFVDVNGQLSLAGTLEVILLGPTPTVGDTFDILDWNTRVGTFDTLDLPGVGDGNTWSIDNLYTTGVLEVIRSGDLDSDGLVGAADLDIILANWEQSVTPFDETMGDVTGDGFVDNDDLQAVLDQFGNTTYPGSTMVPEPGTLALLSMLLFTRGRRRR
ncbi:hypothetical protein OT109_03820 [Phycisphaeraceae bacterium D3-23]